MFSLEKIKNQYNNWFYNHQIIEYFKDMYPTIETSTEKLDSGTIVHRAFSPYVNSNSKEPQIYLFNNYYFFDFESGKRGNTYELIFYDNNSMTEEEKISYFTKKTKIPLTNILKQHEEEWEDIVWENSKEFFLNEEISKFSKLGTNPSILTNGNWINEYSGKTEEPIDYYYKNFYDFKPEYQKTILTHMPTVKKLLEK